MIERQQYFLLPFRDICLFSLDLICSLVDFLKFCPQRMIPNAFPLITARLQVSSPKYYTEELVINMTERCASLKDLNDFNLYFEQLKSATSFNITELDRCKEEICGAIWGDANPDISGIGVSELRLTDTMNILNGTY